jgi:hypothetical protein
MALDDADRRSLEEIERQLTLETPKLAKVLSRERRVRRSVLPPVPVAAATVVLLVAFGWMSALAGSVVPLLLAVPPAVVAAVVLIWQHTAGPRPARSPGTSDRTSSTPHDGPPTWWFT